MKKILSIILVLTLVCASTLVSFADSWKHESNNWVPPGLAKKGGMPPGIAKKFFDIDGYKWAEDAIEKMAERGVIKGVGDGQFAPKRSVTKLEAIVMALRITGEEDEACEYLEEIKVGKKKFKLKDYLQEWSYGYVALAEDMGILDEADILYFKLNDPATRHEVAKYLVRAIGEEDEAQEHMDDELDFIDASFIPQGSVGYIYIANKEGIITGYEDETFRPFNAVTRAEMAVMVARLDGKFDEDDEEYDIYKGDVTDIDDEYDWIEIDDDEKFEVTRKTKVFFDDDVKGSVKDIEVGDEVRVKVNEDDEAVYIQVDRDLYEIYKGEVEKIDSDYEWVKIEIGSEDKRFDIADDVKVVFDGDQEGDLEDVEVGDEVKVRVNVNDKIVYIQVDRDLYDLFEGEVEKIDSDYEWIKIDIGNEDKRIYVADNVEVVFDNDEEGDLEDLKVGDEVKVRVNTNDKIIYIEVDREIDIREYDGSVVTIDEDDDEYEFWVYTSKIVKFKVDDNYKVKFDEEDGTIEDLRIGDEVEVTTEDDDVIEIFVDRDIDEDIVDGKLYEIYIEEEMIAMKNNSQIKLYSLDDDVKIYLNDKKVRLLDLKKDDSIGLNINDDKVMKIRAYRY